MNAIETSIPQTVSQDDFYWEIEAAEEKRLSDLLDVDFHSYDIAGTFVSTPKRTCQGCGKLSGLDDFVATALSSGVHSKEFIKRALSDETMSSNPRPHYLACAACGMQNPDPANWRQGEQWKAKRG